MRLRKASSSGRQRSLLACAPLQYCCRRRRRSSTLAAHFSLFPFCNPCFPLRQRHFRSLARLPAGHWPLIPAPLLAGWLSGWLAGWLAAASNRQRRRRRRRSGSNFDRAAELAALSTSRERSRRHKQAPTSHLAANLLANTEKRRSDCQSANVTSSYLE